MYGEEEYRKRIEELRAIAVDCIGDKSPVKIRDTISKMIPEDAYIVGQHTGTMLCMLGLVTVCDTDEEEYSNIVEELQPMALYFIQNKHPMDAR